MCELLITEPIRMTSCMDLYDSLRPARHLGGQDNVQGGAGQLMTFFAEVGCQFPQFPFIAYSKGVVPRNGTERQRGAAQPGTASKAQELKVRAADMAALMACG